jgi:CubicO group peptidase (beta-lactamase class C family)
LALAEIENPANVANEASIPSMTRRSLVLGLMFLSAGGCGLHPHRTGPGGRDGGWVVRPAEELGLDTTALRRHQQLCVDSGADACLVAYRGVIVQEWYGPSYEEPMPTMSSVKSWTSVLAMILLQQGKLQLDAPVSEYYPEWVAGREAGVTVRQLLTMTAGLATRTGSEPGPGQSIGYARDKNAFVAALRLDHGPGARWEYSNEGAQVLSPVLEHAAGMPLEEFASKELFVPLGMTRTALRLDEYGTPWTYADAKTTLRDFATIGQLMLNRGRWGGRQIVDSTLIDSLVAPLALNPGYGMLWWRTPDPPGFAAMGFLDTDCFVFPTLDLVVARLQSRPKEDVVPYLSPATLGLFREIVSPLLQ